LEDKRKYYSPETAKVAAIPLFAYKVMQKKNLCAAEALHQTKNNESNDPYLFSCQICARKISSIIYNYLYNVFLQSIICVN